MAQVLLILRKERKHSRRELRERERERAGHGFRVIEGEECVVNE